MNYWAVGTNETIDDDFLSKNMWWTDYSDITEEGKKHRQWIKEQMKVNDKVALKTRNIKGKSLKIFAIGSVVKIHNDFSGFDIQWKKLNPPRITHSTFGQTSTIRQVLNKEAQEQIFGLESLMDTKKEETNIMKIKNIMLYGAPGVGKTHNYKRLITMIENGNNEKTIFDNISKNETTSDFDNLIFEDIKKEKRIEFITFHQSYSYEDFIEGFRPSEEDEKIVRQDGIFKIISDKAKKNLENSQIPKQEYKIDIEELIQKFTNYVQDFLDNEKEFFIDKKVTIKGINDNNAFLLGGSITSPQRLTPDIIKRDYIEFKNGNIKSYEDVKPTYESQRNFHGNARYYFMIYNKIAEFEKTLNIDSIQKQNEEQKYFYIVIDEINRGNISKIFGELITLIEEDKRGKKEYEVTLPYSKKSFLIPENLYIIATMNSTDKSIATIDIALRRRFTFLKMKPNLDLVENQEAKKLMEDLNKHISNAINEDYQLGHSYFMKIENEDDLSFVKEYKIKPLLEEYFYGDEVNFKKAIEILDIKE